MSQSFDEAVKQWTLSTRKDEDNAKLKEKENEDAAQECRNALKAFNDTKVYCTLVGFVLSLSEIFEEVDPNRRVALERRSWEICPFLKAREYCINRCVPSDLISHFAFAVDKEAFSLYHNGGVVEDTAVINGSNVLQYFKTMLENQGGKKTFAECEAGNWKPLSSKLPSTSIKSDTSETSEKLKVFFSHLGELHKSIISHMLKMLDRGIVAKDLFGKLRKEESTLLLNNAKRADINVAKLLIDNAKASEQFFKMKVINKNKNFTDCIQAFMTLMDSSTAPTNDKMYAAFLGLAKDRERLERARTENTQLRIFATFPRFVSVVDLIQKEWTPKEEMVYSLELLDPSKPSVLDVKSLHETYGDDVPLEKLIQQFKEKKLNASCFEEIRKAYEGSDAADKSFCDYGLKKKPDGTITVSLKALLTEKSPADSIVDHYCLILPKFLNYGSVVVFNEICALMKSFRRNVYDTQLKSLTPMFQGKIQKVWKDKEDNDTKFEASNFYIRFLDETDDLSAYSTTHSDVAPNAAQVATTAVIPVGVASAASTASAAMAIVAPTLGSSASAAIPATKNKAVATATATPTATASASASASISAAAASSSASATPIAPVTTNVVSTATVVSTAVAHTPSTPPSTAAAVLTAYTGAPNRVAASTAGAARTTAQFFQNFGGTGYYKQHWFRGW